jgi:ketosteroid isomerase-like protein
MKSVFGAGIIVVMVAAATMGQTPTPGQPEKALQDAMAARLKAISAGDAETWGKYTTDDFIVIEPDGAIKTKAQRMAEIKSTSPSSAGGPGMPTDQKWRMYESSTAVSTMQTSIDGKPTRVTSVWVKQQGDWKAASVQLTTITAGK